MRVSPAYAARTAVTSNLLAFSCKGRWFCPSCHAKKVIQFGDLLSSTILSPLPHRQYVFTLPKILHLYFKYNRRLLTKLCQCANRAQSTYFKTSLGVRTGAIGTVTAIQTFGDYGRWHPHLHLLVANGLFLPNGSFPHRGFWFDTSLGRSAPLPEPEN